MENKNKLIDFNLQLIFDSKSNMLFLECFKNFDGTNLTDSFIKNKIAKILHNKGLVTLDKDNIVCTITEHGYEIVETGGWLKFVELEKQKEKIELEKSNIDFKLKKWQLKTFWWVFGFAIIGSSLSFYNFINSLMPSKDVKEQEEKIIRMESELSKLRTLVLYQKKVDSLRNSNSYKKE